MLRKVNRLCHEINGAMCAPVIPEFVNAADGPRDINVTTGDDVVINCRTYADPTASVVWYINGYSFEGGSM